MSVGKEELSVLERLAKEQIQVYSDAADMGIWETPAVHTAIVVALGGLKSLEGCVSRVWATGAAYVTRIGFETEGNKTVGVRVEVIRNRVTGPRIFAGEKREAFYTIKLESTEWITGTPVE